ncbi:hypothetical protein N8944_00760, partial [Pseudomonadales bacterium]|nr:hypothetical protein [Pseudomonadales bacterium]
MSSRFVNAGLADAKSHAKEPNHYRFGDSICRFGGDLFAAAVGIFSILLAAAGFGVFEWAGFAGLESLRAKLFYTGLFVLMAAGLYLLKAYFADFIGLVAMLWM